MHIARVLSVAKQSQIKEKPRVVITAVTNGKFIRAKNDDVIGARKVSHERVTTTRTVKNLDGFTSIDSRHVEIKPTSTRSVLINTNDQSQSKTILESNQRRTSINAEAIAANPHQVKTTKIGATIKAHNSKQEII